MVENLFDAFGKKPRSSDRVDSITYNVAQYGSLKVPENEFNFVDGAARIAKNPARSIVITRDERPVGIMTDTDIRNAIARSSEAALRESDYKHVTTENPVTIKLDEPIEKAVDLMNQHNINRLVVVKEDGTSLGITTRKAIIDFLSR